MEKQNAKVITKNLKIEKKVFVSQDGEKIEYISYSFEVDGQVINLYPKAEDKKLANFLLKGLL